MRTPGRGAPHRDGIEMSAGFATVGVGLVAGAGASIYLGTKHEGGPKPLKVDPTAAPLAVGVGLFAGGLVGAFVTKSSAPMYAIAAGVALLAGSGVGMGVDATVL